METKEIELAHHGDGTVWFRTDDLRDDQQVRFAFRDEAPPRKRTRTLLYRSFRVNPVVMDIYRSGFLQNGCVGLFGTIGSHKRPPDCVDFSATIQVDGDIVCKIDRLVLSKPGPAARLESFARIQALFIEELQQVTTQFKNRVLGSLSAGSIGAALYFYYQVIRQLFP